MDITQKFVMTFTSEELGTIQAGLLELPGKRCNPVLAEIDRQFRKQIEQSKHLENQIEQPEQKKTGDATDGIKS